MVERRSFTPTAELEALLRLREAANSLGHEADFIFRTELRKIPQFDAVFIRSLTDPLNASYVAARIAELH